jgi:Transglutaminase-like superfamily
VHKVKLFFLLDYASRMLLVEAFILLAWARILKGRPFSKVAPTLGQSWDETTYHSSYVNIKQLKTISQAIQIMSRYTSWESKCLVKAIAGMKMLERRKIDSTLYLGTSRDKNNKLIAHAWLRSGPFILTGAKEMEKFTVVNKFAKKFSNECIEGENDE